MKNPEGPLGENKMANRHWVWLVLLLVLIGSCSRLWQGLAGGHGGVSLVVLLVVRRVLLMIAEAISTLFTAAPMPQAYHRRRHLGTIHSRTHAACLQSPKAYHGCGGMVSNGIGCSGTDGCSVGHDAIEGGIDPNGCGIIGSNGIDTTDEADAKKKTKNGIVFSGIVYASTVPGATTSVCTGGAVIQWCQFVVCKLDDRGQC
jgi:hypothetical protein